MSYKALYRKYRPSSFSDVVGQEHITKTLQQQLASGKIFHAYLFTGTRGTGKTTCAKILAKAVNCLNPENGDPCGKCQNCKAIENGDVTDIVEIDAASNNSVDDIRELREQINFTPASVKYRVYIIDEVHMLSISAFNALLKTLEEPPAHVIFILATTEVHKLPATILSRCQRFDFKRIDPQIICERIQYVAKCENFSITQNAAHMIAAIADGGMRDALSTLDLCASASREIDEKIVEETCGMASSDYLFEMADCIINLDAQAALLLTNDIYNASVDMLRLLNDLILHFRNLMIIKTVKSDKKPIICSPSHLERLIVQAEKCDIKTVMLTLRILQDTLAKMQSGNRRTEMELMLIKLCSPRLRSDIDSLEQRIVLLESTVKSTSFSAPDANRENAEKPTETVTEKSENLSDGTYENPAPDYEPENTAHIEDEYIPPAETEPYEPAHGGPEYEELPETPVKVSDVAQAGIIKVSPEDWSGILSELSKSVPLLGGILHNSCAYIDGNRLLVDSENPQFADMMNASGGIYKEKLRRAAETVLGKSFSLGPYRKASSNSSDPLDALRDKLKSLEVPKSYDKK